MSKGEGTKRPDALKVNESPETAPGGVNDSRAPAGEVPGRNVQVADASQRQGSGAPEASDDDSVGGVFAPEHERKGLFTEKVRLRFDDLPRWHPEVILDGVMLEDTDE